jgi:M6 family metalloprotease-like protein
MRSSLLALLLLWAGSGAGVVAQSPATEVTGTLHVLWGDPPEGPPVLRYLLAGDDGVSRMVDVDENVLAGAGGLLLVNGSRMRVQLTMALTPQERPRARILMPLTRAAAPAILTESQAVSAQIQLAVTRPYVTILCRFADTVNELPGTKEHYEQLTGAAYPGVNHYWTEVTEGGITLDGSIVVGWYTLPHPRSMYVTEDSSADLSKLLTDCTGAADPDVDYSRFQGINLQFNKNLDCCSWGGGRMLTLDGVTRFWATTWEAAWAGPGTYAHEVGHSLGLPHSGGPYGNVYDSRYDVMSSSSWYRDPATNFALGSHTIGYHKDRLGAIPAGRRVVAAGPLTRVALERSALPRANAGAQLLLIPVREETGEFYTVESRGGGGYDAPLAPAVVIHYVNPRRSEPAQIVDVDGNGNVNDAGAQWVTSEMFRDTRHNIAVVIDSVRGELTHVTVLRDVRPWLELAPAVHAHRVPYGSTEVVRDSAALQTSAGLVWQAMSARRHAQVLNPAGTGGVMLRWQRLTRGLAPGVYLDTIRVLSPGASGHLAFTVDSLIVAEPASTALSISLSAIARADSIFQTATGYADSIRIRFAGTGATTAAWSVTKSRSSTIVQSALAGVGDGTIRWYHWASGLTPGVYVDTLTVTAPGAAGSPLMIVDTLHVHELPTFTVERFTIGHPVLAEGSTVRDSVRVTPTGRWATAGTWAAAYQGAPSYIRLLDQRAFSGSIVVPFERRADDRAPGLYVDTLRLSATIPMTSVLLIDTMEVQLSPLTLQLSWNSRRDSVIAGVAQDADSVLVLAAGPGANTRRWAASVSSTARITLARRDAFTAAGRGTGTAWLRWFRNMAGREPGLHVDTITVTYADTALSAALVDSVVVVLPITPTLSVLSDSVRPIAVLGQTYADTLRSTGGDGAYDWSIASGALPIGLALAHNGVLSGTPTQVGSTRVVARVGSATQVADLPLRITVAGPLVITSVATLRAGRMGTGYADTLRASSGIDAVTWSLADGALPAGITLDEAAGVLAGVPEEAGEFTVGVRATAGALHATATFQLSITRPVLAESAVIDQLLGGSALAADEVRFLDLLGNRNGRIDVGDARAWIHDTGRLDTGQPTELQRVIEQLDRPALRRERLP